MPRPLPHPVVRLSSLFADEQGVMSWFSIFMTLVAVAVLFTFHNLVYSGIHWVFNSFFAQLHSTGQQYHIYRHGKVGAAPHIGNAKNRGKALKVGGKS